MPPLSFQNKALSMIQYFVDLILKILALVLDKPGGAYRFIKTSKLSTYQRESMKASLICGVTVSSWSSRALMKFISKASQFNSPTRNLGL